MRSGVFSFCKAIDTFCPLGPWIVTPEETADPHDLAMQLRVNGEVRQESHSGNMSVTIPEILSNFSGARLLGRGRAVHGDRLGCRRASSRPRSGLVCVPEARGRDRGRDRGDRRAAEPGRLVAGRARDASAPARPPVGGRLALARQLRGRPSSARRGSAGSRAGRAPCRRCARAGRDRLRAMVEGRHRGGGSRRRRG